MKLDELGFGLSVEQPVVTAARSFRPPTWPPPSDWVCVEDALGRAVSRYGDPVWDLSLWAGTPMKLNFGDGVLLGQWKAIDSVNADLLRLCTAWRIWGPRAFRAASTVLNNFQRIRPLFVLCAEEGILASDLMRFPLVRKKLPERFPKSQYRAVVVDLQWLLDSREALAFVLLDEVGIRELVSAQPDHETEQTAWIPPRIWTYQITRLRLCLEEFQAYQQQIEDCFLFCLDAYKHNYGELESIASYRGQRRSLLNPFCNHIGLTGEQNGKRYLGQFRQVAERFGIAELIERWVGCKEEGGIDRFGNYLTLIRYVGFAYVLNFSLMRSSEGRSLRCDCHSVEKDPHSGELHIISGETTKTDPDSDARWVISPSAQIAIDAMATVARLVMRYAKHDPRAAVSEEDEANPFLFGRQHLPWSGGKQADLPYSIRPQVSSYAMVLSNYPSLFDEDIIRMTSEDLSAARKITRNLNPYQFQVGKSWPFAWHQLRRTGAVNMWASGLISESSMVAQLKHRNREMSAYYGQGYTDLCLNSEARAMLVQAQYEVLGLEIKELVSTDRYVSPHGEGHKLTLVAEQLGIGVPAGGEWIQLLAEKDAQYFEKKARSGEIAFRRTLLGGCMKNGMCKGDCTVSIAHCSGGDGNPACKDVLFDRQRAVANQIALKGIVNQMESMSPDTARYRALAQEKRGLEIYFEAIGG